jgi:hypothetical protein
MWKRLAIPILLMVASGLAQQSPSNIASLVTHAQSGSGDSLGRPFYRYAYYLFLSQAPRGCEDCYIPLLITTEPLEKIAHAKGNATGVWIITYERDSIWQFDGTVELKPESIDAQARKVAGKGRQYRYQEAPAAEVVKLLRQPLGTIPISRPFLVNIVPPGASIDELLADFQTIVRVRERWSGPVSGQKDGGTTQPSFTSLLTVLSSGQADFDIAEGCFDRSRWDCPAAESHKTLHYQMSAAEISELETLLQRNEVKQASDFMNAVPISNDYEIQIPRPDSVQNIEVLAWMPDHVEVRQHPALLHLICAAKEIEHRASSNREIPSWCNALPPLQ